MAHIKTQIGLLTKYLLSKGFEKVKAIDNANLYDDHAHGLHEVAKFVNNQRGFWTYNSGNPGQSYQRDGYYDRRKNCCQGN